MTVHLSCGLALRIPDSIYITTSPSVNDELNTDLVAPAASSLSQYFQLRKFPQPSFFQQPSHQQTEAFPFLFVGPLALPESQESQDIQKSTESSQSQERSSYNLYRPSPEDNPDFMDMLPPPEQQSEPNYYAIKPRKNKKYAEVDSKEKKLIKKKNVESLKQKIVNEQETESNDVQTISAELPNESDGNIRRERDISNENENLEEESTKDDSVESAPSSRLDFQMHGKN